MKFCIRLVWCANWETNFCENGKRLGNMKVTGFEDLIEVDVMGCVKISPEGLERPLKVLTLNKTPLMKIFNFELE